MVWGGSNVGGGSYQGFGTPIQGNMNMPYQGGWQPPGGHSGANTPGYGQPQAAPSGGSSTASSSTSGGADSAARQYLTGVVSGQNTPYNQTTRDSMYSQQSGMAGAAEAGRNQQIAEQSAIGGASPSDPSYQRLIRQSMAARQSQNQQSMGDIDRTANIANQQTQQQAAGALMGSEDERYALQQGYNQRATQMALGFLGGSGNGSGQSQQSNTVGQQGYGGNYETNRQDPYGQGVSNQSSGGSGGWNQDDEDYYQTMERSRR